MHFPNQFSTHNSIIFYEVNINFFTKQKNKENREITKSAMPYGTHYYIITAIRNHRHIWCVMMHCLISKTFPCHAFKIIPSFNFSSVIHLPWHATKSEGRHTWKPTLPHSFYPSCLSFFFKGVRRAGILFSYHCADILSGDI